MYISDIRNNRYTDGILIGRAFTDVIPDKIALHLERMPFQITIRCLTLSWGVY